MNAPLVSCPFPFIRFGWVCCCTHPKQMTVNGQLTRGAFIINDFLRNPHFNKLPGQKSLKILVGILGETMNLTDLYVGCFGNAHSCLYQTTLTIKLTGQIYWGFLWLEIFSNCIYQSSIVWLKPPKTNSASEEAHVQNFLSAASVPESMVHFRCFYCHGL